MATRLIIAAEAALLLAGLGVVGCGTAKVVADRPSAAAAAEAAAVRDPCEWPRGGLAINAREVMEDWKARCANQVIVPVAVEN